LLVMLMKADQTRFERKMRFQFLSAACIFAQYVIDVLKGLNGARRKVLQISDRGGNDCEIQNSFRLR
jgi:hypothetical protein